MCRVSGCMVCWVQQQQQVLVLVQIFRLPDVQMCRCEAVKHDDMQTSCRGGKDDDEQSCRGGG